MKRLAVDQIIALHSQLISATGGLDGVRDRGGGRVLACQCF